jgi:hypothetical protein
MVVIEILYLWKEQNIQTSFLFPYMQQLTDTLPNFSRIQLETNCAHGSNGRMREVGWRARAVVHG